MKLRRYFTHIIFFLIAQVSCCFIAISQARTTATGTYNQSLELMTDVSGKPMYLKVNYNIDGSPFYPEDYYRASLYTRGGKVYEGINVKFNMMDNLLVMKLDDETELVAVSPITRVLFTDSVRIGMLNTVFEKGFPPVGQQTEQTYYEVLDSGRVKLLKQRSATYTDKKDYGQASITRVFEIKESYFLFFDGKMNKLTGGKDGLLALIPEKKEELNQYLVDNNLKCRKENELSLAIAFYNSLFKKP